MAATGYPINVITRAREHGDAGWKPRSIAGFLKEEFELSIPEVTIRRWVDQDYAERQRESVRIGRSRMLHRWGWQRRLRRIRELRDADLDYPSIAKVVRLDFGLDLNREQLERLVRGEVGEDYVRAVLSCPRPAEAEAA